MALVMWFAHTGDAAHYGGWRFLNTIIGISIGFAVSRLVWPIRGRNDISDAIDRALAATRAALDALARGASSEALLPLQARVLDALGDVRTARKNAFLERRIDPRTDVMQADTMRTARMSIAVLGTSITLEELVRGRGSHRVPARSAAGHCDACRGNTERRATRKRRRRLRCTLRKRFARGGAPGRRRRHAHASNRTDRRITAHTRGAAAPFPLPDNQNTPDMTTSAFVLPIQFDLAATFLMAMTGVWAANRRGYDVVGAFTLAFVSGVGGGLLRDSIFLSQSPAVMQNPRYLFAILAAVVIGGLLHRLALRFERLLAYVDAIAVGVYAVVGADKALVAGISFVGSILIGMTNAVGGGLLRDILVREEPLLFKPGQFYVLAALVGCVLFVSLIHQGRPAQEAALAAIAVTLLVRLLAIRFNWKTVAMTEWGHHLESAGRKTIDAARATLKHDRKER